MCVIRADVLLGLAAVNLSGVGPHAAGVIVTDGTKIGACLCACGSLSACDARQIFHRWVMSAPVYRAVLPVLGPQSRLCLTVSWCPP